MSTNPNYDKTDTTKNENLLKASRPKSSRLIKEDYTIINTADAFTTNDSDEVVLRAVSTN